MKNRFQFLIIICSLTLLVLMLCNFKSSSKNYNEMIFDCNGECPEWFRWEMEQISKKSSIFYPIRVFFVETAPENCILVVSRSKNSRAEINIFNPSGRVIETSEQLYSTALEKYNLNEMTSVWPN